MEKSDKEKNKLTKWLNKLQQESWQLELVVSGFAIFLMANALGTLDDMDFMQKINNGGLGEIGAALGLGFMLLASVCFFILINLVLHVLLRGLWISTIGLRYVSGDIDFEKLNLAPKFENFLKKRIGSFDNYILRLENICSVVFAFTFLIVFMLVGFGLFFLFFIFLIHFVENNLADILPEGWGKEVVKWTSIVFVFGILLSSIIYFIDFVTLGWLKKKRWLSRFYFPVYRFFSFITLASLYRPMYYNLIDNKFGRRIGFLLVPYLVCILLILSFEIKTHLWFPEAVGVGEEFLRKPCYDDQRLEEQRVANGSLPSKYVKNGFLELFVHYRPFPDDNTLEVLCPNFRHSKETGLESDLQITTNGEKEIEEFSPIDSSLICVSGLYEIVVGDSVFEAPKFYFHEHKNKKEKGLIAILDVKYLSRGPHRVSVHKLRKRKVESGDTLVMTKFISIPFWVE